MQSYPFLESKARIIHIIEAWTQEYALSYHSDFFLFVYPERCFKNFFLGITTR